nr:hypothetical protein [Tanacetum cinerariifolium]
MENVNPPLAINHPVLPATLRVRINQELHELHVILTFDDSRLESIEQFLNNFANQLNGSDDESVDTPLVSPFPHSDNDSDDDEVASPISTTLWKITYKNECMKFSSKTKIKFSQSVEMASRFTHDAVTTTTMMGSDIPDGVKCLVIEKLENLKSIWELRFPVQVSHAHCAALSSNTPPDLYSAASHFGGVTDWYQSQDTIMSDSKDSTVTYTTALPPPDYVPGPKEPEQAPPSPIYIPYVPKPVYPEYIPPEDDVFPAEEQLLPAVASPIADSPGYIPESDLDEDPEDDDDEDPEEDPVDYPADHDDDEEEEPSGDDADEEDEDDDDEEEEYPASADSIPFPLALRVTARISFRPQPPTLFITKEEAERFLAMPIPPPSPLTLLSSLLPQIPSPTLPASPPLQLLSSDHRADRPEVTLPPQKRLSIVHCPGYEAEESSVAAIENIGYGIRDTWIDPRDVAEEEALTTLEGVNTRVTELAAVQEQDTQDIYRVMEDTQGRQT